MEKINENILTNKDKTHKKSNKSKFLDFLVEKLGMKDWVCKKFIFKPPNPPSIF